ncbi:MAG: hypothetical protein HS116_02180 [Planctomycetes bacterium]|nr:hypothetical protein [Planctomycetota bacterium]
MPAPTIMLAGQEVSLRKWPMRPGFKHTCLVSEIVAKLAGSLGGGAELDFTKLRLAELVNDQNFEQCVAMVRDGLAIEAAARSKEFVEALSFEEFCAALEAVLAHNLVFLKGRLGAWQTSSAMSTTPAQGSPGSASPSSAPSMKSQATT